MGYVLSPTHPLDFRAIPCPSHCNTSVNRLKLRQSSGVKGTQQQWLLTNGIYHPSLKTHIKDLVALLHAPQPAGFWYFHGPNGVGKSYILIAAVNQAIRTQRSALYMTSIQLLDLLRAAVTKQNAGPAEHRLLRQIASTTVLAIDELGRERKTDYALEKLFQILNQRYEDAYNFDAAHPAKLTFLAGNFKPSEMEPYLQSRLQGRNSRIINLSNLPDRRTKNT